MIDNYSSIQRKQFVVATANYGTQKENLLSFEQGDYIQLVAKPDGESPPALGTWIYGKLEDRFGWIPADYVIEADKSQDEEVKFRKLYDSCCRSYNIPPML